ncbi:MAG: amidase domain-containing protein [Erysipelotrichaceae bacterium]|nr:amidase domain-containing protein [Erysipelotrichaceae bacterium]
MKLKTNVLMILILLCLLVMTLLSSMIYKSRVIEERRQAEIIAEQERLAEEERQRILAGPDTYKGTVSGEDVPAEVMNVITEYLDLHFRSMYRLEMQDDSALFAREYYQTISKCSTELIVETRKAYDFDFKMHDAHYDLNVTDYYTDGEYYYVTLTEDDYFSFNFLEDIESSTYDVYTTYRIINDNGTYKIYSMYKEQGFYIMFYDETETVEELQSIYDFYLSKNKDLIAYEKTMKETAATTGYTSTRTFTNSYNRDAAVAYADQYFNTRNPDWYNFDEIGGNCQNYASQAILAGGIPMDYTGAGQWKCYGASSTVMPEIDNSENASGRTASWVNVNYFYEYAINNTGYGMAAENVLNIFFAEPGDIIQVSYNDANNMAHTTIVSKVVDGHALVDSNSIDMKDYPIEAYVYPYRRLIKILGYNQ